MTKAHGLGYPENVLVVDGEGGNLDVIISCIARGWPDTMVDGVADTATAALRLGSRQYDLTVIDGALHDSALFALAAWALNNDTPVLIISSETAFAQQLDAAGFPYLSKPFLQDQLIQTSQAAIVACRDDIRQMHVALDIARRRMEAVQRVLPAPAVQADACGDCRHPAMLPPMTMAFQPIIDLAAQTIIAHEALVRGADDESAERIMALLTSENRYTFDQTCRVTAIEMAARLGIGCDLHINFMPAAIHEPNACLRQTLTAARLAGFPLERLVFEVVEDREVTDDVNLAGIFAACRRHHFKVALDDFGTGFSGLSRLADLRPEIVKLDRALIAGCDRDPVRLEIIASLASLCRRLQVKLIAEGVETSEELDAIRKTGVNFFQGYFFARPAFQMLVPLEHISFIPPATAGPAPTTTH